MSSKRSHRDDVLFISALGTLLLGLGLLLRTTGVARNYSALWPVIVMAAGGILCWFAFARNARPAIFAGGAFFLLFGGVALLASLFHWRPATVWPLFMSCLGLAWLAGGIRHYRRAKMKFVVPSVAFFLSGMFFALFSFKIVGVSFGRFMITWWPSFLIAGGVVLFIAWGVTRKRPSGRGDAGHDDPDRGL